MFNLDYFEVAFTKPHLEDIPPLPVGILFYAAPP